MVGTMLKILAIVLVAFFAFNQNLLPKAQATGATLMSSVPVDQKISAGASMAQENVSMPLYLLIILLVVAVLVVLKW